MKQIFLIILIFLVVSTKAQTVILDKIVTDYGNDSLDISDFQKATKLIEAAAIGTILWPVSASEVGAGLKKLPSIAIQYGTSFQLNTSNFLKVSTLLTYNYFNFNLDQTASKILPNTTLNDKEVIRLHALNFGGFFRFIYRPNHDCDCSKKYLDLGANILWIFGSNNTTWNNGLDDIYTKTKIRHLPYVEKFQYATQATIGIGSFTVNGVYRMSSIFKSTANIPELPKLIIGFGYSFEN